MQAENPNSLPRLIDGRTGAGPMIRKGFLALLSQVLISGMNFVLSLLLARWLEASQYGAYTLAFSIFLVVSSFHNSLLLEPMGVLGPASHGKSLSSYVGKLVRLHFAVACVLAMVVAIAGVAFSRVPQFGELSGALAGACLATPWILFLWFARQAAYLEMRPDIAAKGAVAYAVAISCMIYWLRRVGRLDPFGAFVALAVASAVAGVVLILWIRPRFKSTPMETSLATIWKQHWVYGRWVLATAFVFWASGQATYTHRSGPPDDGRCGQNISAAKLGRAALAISYGANPAPFAVGFDVIGRQRWRVVQARHSVDHPSLRGCRCRVSCCCGRIRKTIDRTAVSRKVCSVRFSASDAGALSSIHGRVTGTGNRAAAMQRPSRISLDIAWQRRFRFSWDLL